MRYHLRRMQTQATIRMSPAVPAAAPGGSGKAEVADEAARVTPVIGPANPARAEAGGSSPQAATALPAAPGPLPGGLEGAAGQASPRSRTFDPEDTVEQVGSAMLVALQEALGRARRSLDAMAGAPDFKTRRAHQFAVTVALQDAARVGPSATQAATARRQMSQWEQSFKLREREVAARELQAQAAAEGKLGVRVEVAVGIKLDVMERFLVIARTQLGPGPDYEALAARARQELESEEAG